MHDAFLHLSASGHLCPLLMGTLMMRYLHHICSCSLSWRLSQKPLKSKFLSICHWQVFKMILRADTFSFRLYWTFPYFFNAAFLKPSIYAEWWWKFKSFHQVQGSTHCKQYDEQSNIFTSIPMNVISKFTGEKTTEWAYQSDLAHNITQ